MYPLFLTILLAANVGLFTLWRSPEVKDSASKKMLSAEEYKGLVDSVKQVRDSLGKAYNAAENTTQKNAVLIASKEAFVSILCDDIFQQWYGTSWDFYGTSQTPRKGKIACGYFVTTALRDAGVRLDRVSLAECASETMIRKLVSKDYITVYRGKTIAEFTDAMLSKGDGLYILGLDIHTGFLQCEGGKAYFIHAYPPGVSKMAPHEAELLAQSNYRVAGSLTADDGFFRRWILQETL